MLGYVFAHVERERARRKNETPNVDQIRDRFANSSCIGRRVSPETAAFKRPTNAKMDLQLHLHEEESGRVPLGGRETDWAERRSHWSWRGIEGLGPISDARRRSLVKRAVAIVPR
jgi:hypothetical protein